MDIRNAVHPKDVKDYDTQRLRDSFLIKDLFQEGKIKMMYSHIDRIIVGGVIPTEQVRLEVGGEIRAEYFLQRREMGIINIGGFGKVIVDGHVYELDQYDGLYIGRGAKEILFESKDLSMPAKFYFNSAPAHKEYPIKLIRQSDCQKIELGSLETSNHRTICKYILPGQVDSCQLVMGMTTLKKGSVWNTMPCHTHDRRMEVYLYLDLEENDAIFHYMGEPQETRHIVMRNEEAVISPSWSIHSACGTRNYSFIWGMVGENQDFDDMDGVAMEDLL